MPGTMTIGGPDPTATMFIANSQLPTPNSQLGSYQPLTTNHQLVPQRLSGLERVLDPLLRLALRHQAQERLSLQIEQLLLRDGRRMWERSSRHDRRQLATDEGIVIADACGAPRQVDAELERRAHAVAAHRDRGTRHGRLISLAHALQRALLGVGEQPVRSEERRVGKECSRDWSSDVCSSDLLPP